MTFDTFDFFFLSFGFCPIATFNLFLSPKRFHINSFLLCIVIKGISLFLARHSPLLSATLLLCLAFNASLFLVLVSLSFLWEFLSCFLTFLSSVSLLLSFLTILSNAFVPRASASPATIAWSLAMIMQSEEGGGNKQL